MKNPVIYLISGKARHGKDTCASMIKDIYEEEGLKVINLQFASYIKEYAKKISSWDGSDETKPRTLLQELGTEVIRKNIDEEFFVKRIIDDIRVYSYYFDVITISDCRFKIEIERPKENFKNIKVINIFRPNFDNGLNGEQSKHATEVDLDDYDNYDFKIINDGTLDDLKEKVKDVVKEVQDEK